MIYRSIKQEELIAATEDHGDNMSDELEAELIFYNQADADASESALREAGYVVAQCPDWSADCGGKCAWLTATVIAIDVHASAGRVRAIIEPYDGTIWGVRAALAQHGIQRRSRGAGVPAIWSMNWSLSAWMCRIPKRPSLRGEAQRRSDHGRPAVRFCTSKQAT